jgi:hypothetical protein
MKYSSSFLRAIRMKRRITMALGNIFEESDELSQKLYLAVLKECVKEGYRPSNDRIHTWVSAMITEVSAERGLKVQELQHMYGSSFDEITDKSVAAIKEDMDREGLKTDSDFGKKSD